MDPDHWGNNTTSHSLFVIPESSLENKTSSSSLSNAKLKTPPLKKTPPNASAKPQTAVLTHRNISVDKHLDSFFGNGFVLVFLILLVLMIICYVVYLVFLYTTRNNTEEESGASILSRYDRLVRHFG